MANEDCGAFVIERQELLKKNFSILLQNFNILRSNNKTMFVDYLKTERNAE